MKLLSLTLENFRGAPNGTFSFTAPGGAPLDTVVVTGPAASGKTSFLEAIIALKESVGAYDMPPFTERLRRRGATGGKVEGTWQLSAEEMTRAEVENGTLTTVLDLGNDGPAELCKPGLRELFQRFSLDPAKGKLEYFSSNRSLGPPGVSIQRTPEQEARIRVGKDPRKYAGLGQALVDLALGDGVRTVEEARAQGILLRSEQRDSLAPYRKDLAEFCPGIRLIGVTDKGKGYDLVFERADGGELGLDDLSESERQAFLFCVTFRRLGLSRSIVLVDAPELHLHADAQARFARALGKLGVDNQIFLATGSLEITRVATEPVIRLGAKR